MLKLFLIYVKIGSNLDLAHGQGQKEIIDTVYFYFLKIDLYTGKGEKEERKRIV